MRQILILLLTLFSSATLLASSESPFLGSREGDPASFVQNVSVIHGDYSELEVDLDVSGPDPLLLSRFYTSQDTLDVATFGGWRFQPQTFFLIRSNPKKNYQTPQGLFESVEIFIGTSDGTLLKFSGFQNWNSKELQSEFRIDLERDESGICNIARRAPSSWTHPKNHLLYYHPKSQSFELQLSSGGKRIYTQRQNTHQFHLKEEILPTGNRISYAYDKEDRLKQIIMTNSGGNKTLSWITFDYGSSILAAASDGTFAEYHIEKDLSGTSLLTEVKKISSSSTYRYQIEGKRALLVHKESPSGRYTEIQYESAPPYRAQTLSVPTSSGKTATHFLYEEGVTQVQAPLGRKTLYTYSQENRLTSIQDLLNDTPYRTLKKVWGEEKDQGNLIAESLEDPLEETLYSKTFSYDFAGNILEETEYGNLTGENNEEEHYTKKFTYKHTPDEDIISETHKKGNKTLTAYIRGTSIPKRREIYENKQVKRRTLYDYNEEGVLIRITLDNGNPHNDLPQKWITVITPKKDLPNLGAPEIIEERSYDPQTKSENLLQKTINHFDSRGFVIKQEVFDSSGDPIYTIEKDYDNRGNLTTYKDPLGNQTTYTYDLNGNLTQQKNQELIVDYDYDIQNNLLSIAYSEKTLSPQKTTFSYNEINQPILEIDPLGQETHYSYDPFGRLIQKTISDNVWSYTYDLFNHQIEVTDPSNNTTTIQYNVRGKPTHIRCGRKEESFLYNLEGTLIRHLTPQGITKTFEYDYLERPLVVKYYEREPLFQSKINEPIQPYKADLYSYNAFQLLSERTSNGTIEYVYNSKGELIQSLFAQESSRIYWLKGVMRVENGEITDFAYDAKGRLIETKKWKDKTHWTLYAQKYDRLGRTTEERIENEHGKLLYKKKWTYTPSGELSSEIGFPNNQETVLTEYSYDSFRRVSQIKKGKSTWDITYEEDQGLLKKKIKDPLGHIIEESYNSGGLLLSHTQKDSTNSPLLKKEFTYNPSNDLAQEKSSDFAISYTHTSNPVCKWITLTRTSPPSFWDYFSSDKQEAVRYAFTYDSSGQLESRTTFPSTATVDYGYTLRGTLDWISYKQTPKEGLQEYHFVSDKHGNITKASLQNLFLKQEEIFTLEKTYNTHHQILTEEIQDNWGSYPLSFTYDGEGYLTKILLPDHSSIDYIYEGPFVSKIKRLSKDNKEIYTYEVTERDLMGNVLEERLPNNLGTRKNTYNSQGKKIETTSDFFSDQATFDLIGNLTQKTTRQGKEETQTQFTYDPLSQLISANDHSYQYDSLQNLILKDNAPHTITPYNQVVKGDDFNCTYDLSGNLISFSDPLETCAFRFDTMGRLTFAQTSQGKTIDYTYDPDSRRLSKVTHDETIERYFYLNQYELGALDEEGNIKALRIPLNPNSLDHTPILTIELEGEAYLPFADLQRNICSLISLQEKTLVENYHFSPFGAEETPTPKNPWRFQGKRHDPETGLIYYGARYYSPKLCKWISPDPLGSHDSLNLYLFSHNNPLRYYDPWGLAVSKGCECIYHGHPGYYNRPAECICICDRGWIRTKMSETFQSVTDFANDTWTDFTTNTWNDPHFQGGLQAFGGLTEAIIGGAMTFGSGGLAIPVGGLIMAHGLDQFFTGLNAAFSGHPNHTVTTELLEKAGMPPQFATMVDTTLSIAGSMGGLAAIRAHQLATFPTFYLPNQTLTGKYTNFNPSLSQLSSSSSRNRLVPSSQATGSHSVFRRDLFSGKITHYETFRPQTNLYDPKPWESVLRLDNSGKTGVSHFNKVLDRWVYEPHMHDPNALGGIRPAEFWEIPK